MGCCCSTPVPIVWAGYDVSGYDAGDRYRVERVDSDAHALWEATADVLARAFCGTESASPEPVNAWIYNGGTELRPLAAAPTELRAGWFKWALELCARMCLNVGGVYALVEKTTGQVVAATGVMPPGARTASDMSMGEYYAITKKMGDVGGFSGPKVDPEFKGGWERRMTTTDKAMAVAHKAAMPEDHMHVLVFGTCPDAQKTGAGRTLMTFLNHLADVDGVPSYLESAGEIGPAFFADVGGYEEVQRVRLEDKKGTNFDVGGGMVCMARKAQRRILGS